MKSSWGLILFMLSLGFAQLPESKVTFLRGGVYTDTTGAPLAGAQISLVEHVFGIRTLAGKTTTDERGGFGFANLHPGLYSLEVEAVGFVTQTIFEIAPGEDIVVRLERAATISGHVVDGSGRDLENAFVELTSKSYAYGEGALISSHFALTDNRGLYRVSDISPGQYYVRASCAGHETILYPSASTLADATKIDLRSGSDLREIDFRLGSGSLYRLSGQLVDAETKELVDAGYVRAYSADLTLRTFVGGTVRDGRFQIKGMKPGRYFLEFGWLGPTNNANRTAIFPFEMGSADKTDVVLTMMPPTTVTGQVRTSKHRMLRNITVILLPADPAVAIYIGRVGRTADLKGDGSFKIQGVEAGEYRLTIHSSVQPNFFIEDRKLSVDGRHPIIHEDVEMDFSAGSVVGTTLDSDDKTIPNATVVLQSTNVEKRSDDQYRLIRRANRNGEYAITGVVPGDYFLFVWKGDPGLIGDPDLFAQASAHADRVTVDRNATVHKTATELREAW